MRIGVVIPAYNEALYIERCLLSCMCQEELHEIIVVDDGSTDDTLAIAKSMQSKDARIAIYYHSGHVNMGRAASRNLGIRQSKSEWITFCDADDYYAEGRFRSLEQLYAADTDAVYEWVGSVYTDEEVASTMNTVTAIGPYVTPAHLQDYLIRHREERISIIGIIVRRQLLMDIGLFDEELTIGEDTDLIWRMAGAGRLVPIQQPSPRIFRQVDGGNTYSTSDNHIEEKLRFYKKWYWLIPSLGLSPQAVRRITSSYRYYKYKMAISEAGWPKNLFISFKYQMGKLAP